MSYVPHPSASGVAVNKRLSQEAFRKMAIGGQVINQFIYQDGVLVANPLFDELNKQRDRYYVEAYANMGLELVQRPGFFYVRSLTMFNGEEDVRDQEKDSALGVRQIQGVLLVVGRGVLEKGYLFEALTAPDAGITQKTLVEIGTGETMQQILTACGIDRPLVDAVNSHLVGRGIAYLNTKGNLVLADAGKAFFMDIFGASPDENADQPHGT